jgi:RNA polymerase-binding transcription factor DksA
LIGINPYRIAALKNGPIVLVITGGIMNIDTQNHLTQLRDLLVYRLHDLESDVRADELARRPSADRDVTDLKEEAARHMQDSVLEAEERRDVEELQQVRQALARLDAGTYGDCLECGEPIALQRLLVEPAAQRCSACQSAVERAHERMR